jgi:hypothetical protein
MSHMDELRKQMPKPEDWDPRPEEVIASERKLTDHGAVKVVSLWWSDPHVIGVLSDGRRLIVSTPEYHPTDKTNEDQRAALLAEVEKGETPCAECAVYGEENVAADVAYCCGMKKWLPVCREHHEEMGGYGPEECP